MANFYLDNVVVTIPRVSSSLRHSAWEMSFVKARSGVVSLDTLLPTLVGYWRLFHQVRRCC